MRILIIDDDDKSRKLLRVILAAEGHEVIEAEDGLAALNVLENDRVDALISDILMPRMDGYRLCYELRKSSNPFLRALPLVLYSASYNAPADEKVAREFGADRFLIKPALPDVILQTLYEVIKAAKGRQPEVLDQPQALLAMREYSEALVRKLEQTNADLSEAIGALQVSEEKFRQIAENIQVVFWMTDPAKQQMMYVSPAYEAIWGFSSEQLYQNPRNFLDAIVAEDCSRVEQALLDQGSGRYEEEYRILRPDGTLRWIHDRAFPIRNETGEIERVVGIAEDITERKNAQDEVKRSFERIRALHEIDNAITSSLDLETILAVLLEKIELFVPFASASTVRLLDHENNTLVPFACRNIEDSDWRRGFAVGPTGRASRVLQTRRPLAVLNVQNHHETYNPGLYQRHNLVSYLGVPLIVRDKPLGVLSLYTREEHEFSAEEIDFMQTLGGQAAIAINNAQSYDEIHRANQALESSNSFLDHSLKQLAGLYTAMTPLSPAESTQAMIEAILDKLIAATGADAAAIRLAELTSSNYPVLGQRGFGQAFLDVVKDAPVGGAVRWVIENNQPMIVADLAIDERFRTKTQISLGLRSCAILPLTLQGKTRGVIHVSSTKPGYFLPDQKDHLLAIARQLSISIENRELFLTLQSSRDDLARSNQVKDEFLSVISHELRTPLNIVMGYAGILQDGSLGEVPPAQQAALDTIKSGSNDLLMLINGILDATGFEAERPPVRDEAFMIATLLTELKFIFPPASKDNVEVLWDCPENLPIIVTDLSKVKRILEIVLHNAVKFTTQGQVTVAVKLCDQAALAGAGPKMNGSAENSQPWLTVRVTDTGIGIPPEAIPRIFDKFYQADSSSTRAFGGTGLGLYIAKVYTDLLGGQIEVQSEVERGSSFILRVPVRVATVGHEAFPPNEL
jgi:PAS domain S-box-containing protein